MDKKDVILDLIKNRDSSVVIDKLKLNHKDIDTIQKLLDGNGVLLDDITDTIAKMKDNPECKYVIEILRDIMWDRVNVIVPIKHLKESEKF